MNSVNSGIGDCNFSKIMSDNIVTLFQSDGLISADIGDWCFVLPDLISFVESTPKLTLIEVSLRHGISPKQWAAEIIQFLLMTLALMVGLRILCVRNLASALRETNFLKIVVKVKPYPQEPVLPTLA